MYATLSHYQSFYVINEEQYNKEFYSSKIITDERGIVLKNLHNKAGFFSMCSCRLDDIVEYMNTFHKLPDHVDSSGMFDWYKNDGSLDITYDYFKPTLNTSISYNGPIDYKEYYQYENYRTLSLSSITPFISKYFTPTDEIINMKESFKSKYNIIPAQTCVLFYRGNDKNTETGTCSYDDVIQQAKEIELKQPGIRFMIQSDESEFITKMTNEFPNSFYLKDEIRHMNKSMSTVDKVFRASNYEFSKKYLAITLLMSELQYVVCGSSGNCSIWIVLYRGHTNGLYQFLQNQWITG